MAEDIADLTHLNEAGVVDNLRTRYVVVCGETGGYGGKPSWRRNGILKGEGGIYVSDGGCDGLLAG
jgi:hypothetical protein